MATNNQYDHANEDRDVAPVSLIASQARRHARPMVWAGTIAEAVAASSAIAAKSPPWISSALIVGIPLASFGVYQWRKAAFLKRQVDQLFHFDRKYTDYLSRWTMKKSEIEGYWTGIHHGEREMIVLAPIRSWTWNITRRSDDDMPFSGNPPKLQNQRATRSGSGTCTFQQPHKSGANLTFRIEFDPMLRPGEKVSISFDLEVPVYKPATIEHLRMRPAPKVSPPGEAEFSTTDSSYPIDVFVKEVIIPESLGSRRHGLQILRRDNEFVDEAIMVRNHELFKVERSMLDNEPVWVLRLERNNPPLRATYRIHWELPRESTTGANG